MQWATLLSFTSVLLASGAINVNAQTDGQSPPSYPSPWMKGGLGWDEAYAKAQHFVSQLTLLEKVNITSGVGWEGDFCVGNTGSVPRLNFAGLCMQDSPLGVRDTDGNSAFPAGINVASTWSTALMEARGYAMGSEHRGKGVDVQLGPVAGPLGRDPKGGRNWEGFSPDPVLTGAAMAATIKGIQDAGVIACAKHFILNEQEHYREQLSSNVDDKTLHELYLWPFADAVKAGVGSIMCSYNQANNSYACQNSHTLNYLLKNELDFQGFVMSDWNAQHSGVASALAGLDMTMPGDLDFGTGISHWGGNLTAAVVNGTIPQWRLDDMVTRIMSAYYKVGRDKTRVPVNFSSWSLNTTGFIHQQAAADPGVINGHVNVQGNHKEIIREVEGRSVVLLKNTNNALPLKKPASIAVLGLDAHSNPAGPNADADRGGDGYTLGMGWGSGTANFPYLVAPVDALRAKAAHDKSAFTNSSDNYNYATIATTAAGKSVALVFVNADGGEDYITVDGNQGDRNNLTLWQNGDALIKEVALHNPNTIVILHTIGPVLLEAIANNPNVTAILWAGIPGQESGNSITDVLYGDVNPGGKSVFTWGKQSSDWGLDILYNSSDPYPQIEFTEGVFIDYRYFDKHSIAPTYEFGFGLTYTSFSYSNIQIQKSYATTYQPTKGKTAAAKTFGKIDTKPADNQFPVGFTPLAKYVYPYLTSWDLLTGGGIVPPGSQDSSPQQLLGAGGAAGGNPQLYDVLYKVYATVHNTGKVDGIEVVQLYVSLGGPDDPKVQLRGFDDLAIKAGHSATFEYGITRRDLSNWDPVSQNWVVSKYPKTVYVGASSRNLHLSGKLS